MLDEQPMHRVAIVNRRLHQRHAVRQRLRVAGREIVEHGHRVAGIDERAHRVAADVARAAGDDNPRHV